MSEPLTLPNWGLIGLNGPDAVDFAQAQLTSDVSQLNGAHEQVRKNPGQLTAYCEPKGRVIANGYLFCAAQDHLVLAVHASLSERLVKRLRMYVFRSKVAIDAAANFDLVGYDCSTDTSESSLESPASGCSIAQENHAFWLDLAVHDEANRSSASASLWLAAAINAGMPLIQVETSEQFTPQMLNLDQLGAVSFSKGCYPGQEIVARTHYLGKVKRRLCKVEINSEDTPAPGTMLATQTGKAAGSLVNTLRVNDRTCVALAVVHDSAREGHPLRLNDSETEVRVKELLRT